MRNCAIDYYPATYATRGPALMGVNSANEGLLDAFMRHAKVDSYVCHVRNEGEYKDFKARMERFGLSDRPSAWIRNGDTASLARVGALLHPAPGFGPLAWARRFRSCRSYSLCGITHTTATDRVMDSIGNLMVAPVQPWDAVICTSSVVRKTYDRVLGDWADYLFTRYGVRPEAPVQLPVIPLGVDTDSFAATPAQDEARVSLRKRFGAEPEDIVVLWVGRLNPLAKAHPIPTYVALEQMARRFKRKVFYVQAGWFANDATSQAFQAAAREYAPSVVHVFVDGRQPDIRTGVWAAADVFLSLSDNIQETFGLTPIEAMAAGLPVVVSDWDGYRDTVRDGVDGFRIPTWMPEDGNGEDIAREFANGNMIYDLYTGVSCQTIGVDIRACADALLQLAEDPDLRRAMGAAGRERAVSTFDWRHVIAAYQDLWEELARIRDNAAKTAPRPAGAPAFPLRGDPYGVFGSYPTRPLTDVTVMRLSGFLPLDRLASLRKTPLNGFAMPFLGDEAMCRALLGRLENGPAMLGDMVGGRSDMEAVMIRRTVSWLAKMGMIELVREEPEKG